MQTLIEKALGTVMVILIVAGTTALRAQNLTIPAIGTGGSGSTAVDFEFRLDGTFIEKGIGANPTLSGSDLGAGTRLLWYPAYGAFRAGQVTGTDWNLTSYNQGTVAFGLDTTATLYSAAFGAGTLASNYSGAFGLNSLATGPYAFAAGSGTAATGNFSVAFGMNTSATNFGSSAFGQGTSATGLQSFAAGAGTSAAGNASAAFGRFTQTTNDCSFALGLANGNAPADANQSLAVFEIGNGVVSSPTNIQRSDAVVVYQNGDANFQGTVMVKAGGDIPMYRGN